MIQVPGFFKEVYEITSTEFKKPELKVLPIDPRPTNRGRTVYEAPSTSVLVVSEEGVIKLVVGRHVADATLKNVLGYAIKQRKPLEIMRCEVLSNLRQIDDMVALCNKIIKEQDATLDEIRLEIDGENSYNE
jgi:hypothetical protein